MGLDMYLYLRKRNYYCGSDWRSDEEKKKAKYPKELVKFEEEIKKHNFPSVYETKEYQVGYWRKANAVHGWFVENCADGVDNCRDIYVSKNQAKDLLSLCDKVLVDRSKASEELPTQQGFFFGSQEYDQWYFEDIEYTQDLLKKILAFLETKEGKDYDIVYCASW